MELGGPNLRWGYIKVGPQEMEGKTISAWSFNHVNHEDEAPLTSELEPTCG